MATVFNGCEQPLHICECWTCDTERRRRVREFARIWFEEAQWRRLRRKAEARLRAEVEHAAMMQASVSAAQDSLFPSAESGVRPTAPSRRQATTHRGLRPVTRKVAT